MQVTLYDPYLSASEMVFHEEALYQVYLYLFTFTPDFKYSMTKMAEVYYWLKEWLWSEYFWLPPTASWADLQRNQTVFYPAASDMFIPIPLAVGLLVIRLLWERYAAM